jgi:hypothetical protein
MIGYDLDMLAKLPAWIVPNDVSVEREVAPYRGLPLDVKLAMVRQACETAARFAAAHPDPSLVYKWADPLPPSTVVALQRLQEDYRRRNRP